jgi:hypothetical protein
VPFPSRSSPTHSAEEAYIGTNAYGTEALGNGYDGVRLDGASFNTIGGNTREAGNVISGNNIGVSIESGAEANQVLGNFIGTNVFGTRSLGNSVGVLIDNARNNTIGDESAGLVPSNLISGNTASWLLSGTGVLIGGRVAAGNLVRANYIGTDVTGTQPLGNEKAGVLIFRSSD